MQRSIFNTARAIASSSRLAPISRPIPAPFPVHITARQASNRPNRFILPDPPHPSFPPLTHNLIQVVDPETGKLGPPQLLSDVFAQIDATTHYPLMVKLEPPIARITNIQERIATVTKTAEVTEARRKLETEAKEIQVSWSAADKDAQTKLALAQEALIEGGQVNIIFASKAHGGFRKKGQEQGRMNDLVEMFDRGLEDKGTKWRADEVLPKMRKMFYLPLPELRKAAEQRGIEHSGERKKASLDRKEARRKKDEERRLKSLAARGQQDAV